MASILAATTSGKNVRVGLVRQPGGTVRYNKDGSVEASESFECVYSKALQLAPKRYITQHPVFTSLVCNECSVTEKEAGMALVVATYVGDASDAANLGTNRTPEPSYELITEAREEPIETFPDFSTTIGTSANGAKFDSNNLFLGFEKTSEFAGQTSYLVPGSVWRKSGVQRTRPSSAELNAVGRIATPDGPVPATVSPRNWLLRSFTYSLEGNIYRYQKEWILSGPRGWNSTIYAP